MYPTSEVFVLKYVWCIHCLHQRSLQQSNFSSALSQTWTEIWTKKYSQATIKCLSLPAYVVYHSSGGEFCFRLCESTWIPTEGFCENHTKLSVLIGALTHGAATAWYPCMVTSKTKTKTKQQNKKQNKKTKTKQKQKTKTKTKKKQ